MKNKTIRQHHNRSDNPSYARFSATENPFGSNADKCQHAIERRTFLTGLLSLGAGAAFSTLPAAALAQAEQALGEAVKVDPWLTLQRVQQHLFPDDGNGPGADGINALRYLKAVTQQPQLDKESKAFIFNGVGWLNDLAKQRHQKHFAALDKTIQTRLLTSIANSSAGENWLSTLLTYIIEALVADPVYGGNTKGVGWAWLQHQPGFPRPPLNKQWYLL